MRRDVLIPALVLAAGFAAPATSILIPNADWLVPASTLIVIGEISDLAQVRGTTNVPRPDGSELVSVKMRVQVARIEVLQTILGAPPTEPIVINIDLAGIHSLQDSHSYLLFLKPFEGRNSAFAIVEALPIDEAHVSWQSSDSSLAIEKTPVETVLAEPGRAIGLLKK